MNNLKIAIGCDHAGFHYKEQLKEMLRESHEVSDHGTHGEDSVDYPDFVHPVAKSMEAKEVDFGILICGSANGVAMTANKYQNVRAAICWQKELAELARSHNNANILCLPARFVSIEDAQAMVTAFLSTAFEGGRHERRVSKIPCS